MNPFDEWWETTGSEIDADSADEIRELARKAFEAGMSQAIHVAE